MERSASIKAPSGRSVFVLAVLVLFTAAFVAIDQTYYQFASTRFPAVGDSVALATAWGVVSRAHLLLIAIPLVVWRPRELGFTWGETFSHLPLLGAMLLLNCGIVAAFLWTTESTPYSGNQWLLTEVVTVPLIEEAVWRGLVFTALVALLRQGQSDRAARHIAVWSSGLAFGALHAANALVGVPVAFVAAQVASAMVWGVIYGYARDKTGSLYPPIALHAAMNLLVVLWR